jgi:hypothetical protein
MAAESPWFATGTTGFIMPTPTPATPYILDLNSPSSDGCEALRLLDGMQARRERGSDLRIPGIADEEGREQEGEHCDRRHDEPE